MTFPSKPLPGVVYPPPALVQRYEEQGVPIDETLSGAYRQAFRKFADRRALAGLESSMTYAELDRASDAVAAGLARLGLAPLDRAVFQMPNGVPLIICLFACWKAGVIPICTLASHRHAEISYLAAHGGARAYFVQAGDPKFDHVEFALGIQRKLPAIAHVIAAGETAHEGVVPLDELLRTGDEAANREQVDAIIATLDPMQPVVFQLSGGTTGVPKIIPRLHFEYLYNMRKVFEWTGRGADEVVFSAGPIVHNAGMVCHMGPALLHGGAVVTDNLITSEGLRQVLEAHRPTWMFLPRPLVSRMKEAMSGSSFDPSAVHGVVTSANARTVREELGMMGLHIFGMAEGLIITTRPGDPQAARDECVGQPVSELDEALLVEPGTMTPVPVGAIGELVCRGPYTLHGYYDAAERNKDAFTPEGFYRSGDLLSERVVDGQRYFVFEGRLKDVINRGGEKINCDEIERALRGFPGLLDVALVAMPDPNYGEKGCAFIVMDKGCALPTTTALGAYLEDLGLAKFKWPERVEPIDVLPTTASAKISKPLLRQLIADRLKAERGGEMPDARPA